MSILIIHFASCNFLLNFDFIFFRLISLVYSSTAIALGSSAIVKVSGQNSFRTLYGSSGADASWAAKRFRGRFPQFFFTLLYICLPVCCNRRGFVERSPQLLFTFVSRVSQVWMAIAKVLGQTYMFVFLGFFGANGWCFEKVLAFLEFVSQSLADLWSKGLLLHKGFWEGLSSAAFFFSSSVTFLFPSPEISFLPSSVTFLFLFCNFLLLILWTLVVCSSHPLLFSSSSSSSSSSSCPLLPGCSPWPGILRRFIIVVYWWSFTLLHDVTLYFMKGMWTFKCHIFTIESNASVLKGPTHTR